MKKLLAALTAVLYSGAAFAGAVTAPPGPLEPSQIQSIIGQTVNNVNAGVDGIIGVLLQDKATGANTTPTRLLEMTIPQSLFTIPGQILRAECFGTMASNNDGKIIAMNVDYSDGTGPIGTSSYFSSAVISGGTENNAQWHIQLDLVRFAVASPSAWTVGSGIVGSSVISDFVATNANGFSGPQTVRCWGINANSNANDIVARGLIIRQLK